MDITVVLSECYRVIPESSRIFPGVSREFQGLSGRLCEFLVFSRGFKDVPGVLKWIQGCSREFMVFQRIQVFQKCSKGFRRCFKGFQGVSGRSRSFNQGLEHVCFARFHRRGHT